MTLEEIKMELRKRYDLKDCDYIHIADATDYIEMIARPQGETKSMAEVKLKGEYEKLFMVTDKTEMIGTAVNAKLNDVFEWIEQKVKPDYSQLPTNEEIELWAMRTYKDYEDSLRFTF